MSHPCLRVLVLDDNLDCADSLAWLVKYWGCCAFTAYTPEAALAVAVEHRPHAGLIDLALPSRNGFWVAEQLRMLLPTIRLVAVTGLQEETYGGQARMAGFSHYQVKGADPEPLRAVLDQLQACH